MESYGTLWNREKKLFGKLGKTDGYHLTKTDNLLVPGYTIGPRPPHPITVFGNICNKNDENNMLKLDSSSVRDTHLAQKSGQGVCSSMLN